MDAKRIGRRRAWRRGTQARPWAPHWRRLALAVAAVVAGCWPPAQAADPYLGIELNKAEDSDQSCVASFVLRNGLGHTLDRFNLDLFIFDQAGVIARQVLLDLAPLRSDKTTVIRFALIERPCAEIGQVLVNDIPACRAETGESLDCLSGLQLSSRGGIALTK